MTTTNTRTLKGILFDLDDTLIDWSGFDASWEDRDETLLRGVFDYLNNGVHPLDDFPALSATFLKRTRNAWDEARSSLHSPHVGRVLVETLIELGVAEDAIDEKAVLKAYGWGAAPGVVRFPEVLDALKLLHANGVKTGIVTNAYQPMWMRDSELETFELLEYFPECRVSAADAGFLKPHPSIFTHAMELLGTTPEETVFIGDNPVADIAGAQGVGMLAILRVIQPARSMLSGLIVPDHALNSFEELPDILDQWYPGWRA